MSKIKYYYDTETCKYERVKVKKSDVIINALGFTSFGRDTRYRYHSGAF